MFLFLHFNCFGEYCYFGRQLHYTKGTHDAVCDTLQVVYDLYFCASRSILRSVLFLPQRYDYARGIETVMPEGQSEMVAASGTDEWRKTNTTAANAAMQKRVSAPVRRCSHLSHIHKAFKEYGKRYGGSFHYAYAVIVHMR